MAAPYSWVPGFGYWGVKVQTVIGTGVTPTIFGSWSALQLNPIIDSTIERDGTQRDNTLYFKNSQHYEVSWTTSLTPVTGAYVIGLALSGADTITGSADPYLHTIPSATGPLFPFTFEASYGSVKPGSALGVLRLVDCYMTEVKLQAGAGKQPELQCKAVGITAVPGGSVLTPSFEADRHMSTSDAAFTFSGALHVNGAVTDLSIDIKNAMAVEKRGDAASIFLVPGGRDIDLSFDAAPTDELILRDVFFGADTGTTSGQALSSMTLAAKWDLGGMPDHFIQLQANNVQVQDAQPTWDMNGKTFLIKGVKGRAVVSGGTAAAVLTAQSATATAFWS